MKPESRLSLTGGTAPFDLNLVPAEESPARSCRRWRRGCVRSDQRSLR